MYLSVKYRLSWAMITLLGLLLSCKESFDPQMATSTDQGQVCQLLAESTGNNGYQYTYTDKGQLLKRVLTVAGASPIIDTYTYDAAGNVVNILTQGTLATGEFTSTSLYEYTDGRLTKITAHSSSIFYAALDGSYSYDDAGRLATYSTGAADSDSTSISQRYTFTNGHLTNSVISQGSHSVSLSVVDGRIVMQPALDGSRSHFIYDANGYLIRSELFNKAGLLQSYVITEYSPIPFKLTNPPYQVIPNLDSYGIYGRKDLSPAREAVYTADGSLQVDTRYQYQVNSQGYLTSSRYERSSTYGTNQSSVTTYTYSNCQ